MGRDNYGVVITGDGNVIVQVADLKHEVRVPGDVRSRERMLFRSVEKPSRSGSVITWLAPDGAAAFQATGLQRWTEIIAVLAALSEQTDTGTAQRVLLVVDYADNQGEPLGNLLTEIIKPVLGAPLTERVRILLLSRQDGSWWESLAIQHPHHHWVDSEPVELPTLTSELSAAQGADVWREAVERFAVRYAKDLSADTVSAATVLAGRQPPEDPETTLDLYADALLAVLDHVHGQPAPGTMVAPPRGDPVAGVLEHELRIVGHALSGERLTLSVPQRDAALLAVYLRNPRSRQDAETILANIPCPATPGEADAEEPTTVSRLAHALAGIYPGRGSDTFWSAPVPDRLPDTHLLRVLGRHPLTDQDAVALIDHLAGTAAPSETLLVLDRLLRARTTPGAKTRHRTGLARLDTSIQALLQARPGMFLAPITILAPQEFEELIIAGIDSLPRNELYVFDGLLQFLGFTTTRTRIAVAVSRALCRFWNDDPPTHDDERSRHAADLGTLGIRLSEVGQRENALAPTREAVKIRRRLAKTSPDAYLPSLATALINLGAFLSGVGQRENALAPTREAAEICRRLAETNPDAHLPNLVMSLNNLGSRLSEIGQHENALAPTREAVTIRRRLAETNPDAHLPNLAISLNNLGLFLSGVGQREDALAPAREAVTIRRRLAETNPDAHLPDLAVSLGARAMVLRGQDGQAAVSSMEEAVAILGQLSQALPDMFVPWLARGLTDLAQLLEDVGRDDEAAQIRRMFEDGAAAGS